jgi:hypothetical protein
MIPVGGSPNPVRSFPEPPSDRPRFLSRYRSRYRIAPRPRSARPDRLAHRLHVRFLASSISICHVTFRPLTPSRTLETRLFQSSILRRCG